MTIQIANTKTFIPTITIVGKDNWALHEQRLARARELNREGKRRRLTGSGNRVIAREMIGPAMLNVDFDCDTGTVVQEYD